MNMTITEISPPGDATARSAIECRGITKTFSGATALSNIDLAIRPGEIHALLGQNGAGKSTLVKIMTGVYQPDSGDVLVGGSAVQLRTASDAEDRGIAIVHQDQQLVGQFDVTRNIFLGREIVGAGGLLDFRAMDRAAAEALRRIGARFPVSTLARDMTVAQREQAAIAAALIRDPKILILDEPTASLSEAETELLFGIVRALRDQGVTIIYISHYLDEVLSLADRISVLRDGRLVSTMPVRETSRAEIVRMMVGREIAQLYPKEDVTIGQPLLEIAGLGDGQILKGIDLTVRRGEIFGIAGLVGAGRTELALTLMGARPRVSGTVTVAGKPSNPRTPRGAVGQGFALIPEDRRHEGLITDMSVSENLTLPNIATLTRFGIVSRAKEKSAALDLVKRLSIQPPNIRQLTRNLSGGNQQKVVIGRWLIGESEVVLFDEPTTGVDIGSKVDIYRQMVELARRGAAVVFISSDFEELAGMCDRVAVMYKGAINTTLERDEVTTEALLFAATGRQSETAAAAEPAASARPPATFSSLLARWGGVAGMILALVVIALIAPTFVSPGNIFGVLKQGSALAFVALGLTVVLIAGGFDSSAGAVSQLTTNLAAGTLIAGGGTVAAVAIGGVAGLALGALNAALVLIFGMPPFVATLGSMFMIMGATLLYNDGQALTLSDQPDFFFIGQGYIGPVPFVFLLLIAAAAVLHLVLKHTRLGLRMYAVGQNLAAAQLRGVTRDRYAFASFAIGGLVVGLAGVVLASYSYGASALATGFDFLVSAVAAAFLGSTLTRTGELSVVGTAIAALFISSLSNGLILMGISSQALPGLQGLVLILSIAAGVIHKRGIGQVLIF
jgi:ABC-type sugar transport system ATPase subunit/ribose/xylose/arabinose/galactoside ABC-type transport system permease subunit